MRLRIMNAPRPRKSNAAAAATYCQLCRQSTRAGEICGCCGRVISGIDCGVDCRNAVVGDVAGAARGVSGAAEASGIKAPLPPTMLTNSRGASCVGGAATATGAAGFASTFFGGDSGVEGDGVTGPVATGVPQFGSREAMSGSDFAAIGCGFVLGRLLGVSARRASHIGSSASAEATMVGA